jgi:GLPGLI family protein
MQNKTSVLFLFLTFIFSLEAQTKENLYPLGDTIPIGIVIYDHQVHVSGSMDKNGVAKLYFNHSNSLYIHLGDPNEKGELNPNPDGVLIKKVGEDKQGAPIYKMHTERKILYRDLCVGANGRCIVADTLGALDWILHPEHKRFGQYDCRRATGMFHGREYEAWYTLDIPVSSGPFKLGGLPGLILEAHTTDGSADFLFVGIEISKEIPERIKPPYGKDSGLSYDEYQKAVWMFTKNVIDEMKAKGYDVSMSTNPDALELWNPDK